jgi:site-specific recombinase XerD
MLTLLYRSGLRISELLALKPSDVDLAKHSIRVLHGKGDKATVRHFHPSADDALLRWLDKRRKLGLARNGMRLFVTLDGGPVSDDYVRNLLRRLAQRAGIDKRVHPHGLRHTFAVELEAAGTPATVISKLLGHSSVAVTARYLDHLTNDAAGKALAGADLPALDAP